MGPNFGQAYRIANENVLLVSRSITTLPVDIKSHIQEETDITLCTYRDAEENWGLDVSMFGSEDAMLSEKGGRYILFYNSKTGKRRIRWSLTHEAGHFYLGHKFITEALNKDEYGVQEIEANFFAAQVLMPDQIIHELVSRGEKISPSSLMKWFQVSKEAAEKRIKTLNRQSQFERFSKKEDCSNEILIKYASFIDGIKPIFNSDSVYADLEEDERQVERDSWMYDW